MDIDNYKDKIKHLKGKIVNAQQFGVLKDVWVAAAHGDTKKSIIEATLDREDQLIESAFKKMRLYQDPLILHGLTRHNLQLDGVYRLRGRLDRDFRLIFLNAQNQLNDQLKQLSTYVAYEPDFKPYAEKYMTMWILAAMQCDDRSDLLTGEKLTLY